MRSWGK
ncbi:unnamed protein product [Linum tenue]|nr:unnamed protein product [Linum tenue]